MTLFPSFPCICHFPTRWPDTGDTYGLVRYRGLPLACYALLSARRSASGLIRAPASSALRLRARPHRGRTVHASNAIWRVRPRLLFHIVTYTERTKTPSGRQCPEWAFHRSNIHNPTTLFVLHRVASLNVTFEKAGCSARRACSARVPSRRSPSRTRFVGSPGQDE